MNYDLINIAEHYGLHNQLVKTLEELGELCTSISKYIQLLHKTDISNCDYAKIEQAEKSIFEESADVKIMLAQLDYLLNNTETESMIDYKIKRTIKRIEENTDD